MGNRRIVVFKSILWILSGLAAGVAVLRFWFGLGPATALSDTTPWGLWIGFDVMGGVALAAGGFVVAAVVHIFHREKYHHVARPAILTAFLGYAAVAVGLLFDLGLPWNIWHPVIFWNIRSALFEVAWCVMLYLTVLALEVAPFVLERTPLQGVVRTLRRLSLPIMILGIMLSTLHQSSLGSLLLIMPFRLHPLWYTSLLPELFFVSAICLGLTMVMFESSITSWLYKRKPETEALAGLGRMAVWGLSFYLAFKLIDLAVQGKLGLVVEGTWASNLFIVEMLMSTVVPIVLFAIPAVRRSPTGIWMASSLAVLGFILNRVNSSGLSQVWVTQNFYFPAWTEFAISFGLVSAFALVFFFIQEHLPVDPHELDKLEQARVAAEQKTPTFAPFTQVWLGEGWRKAAKVYSLLFAVAMAVGLTFTPTTAAVIETPSQRARGADVLRMGVKAPYVYFNHAQHQQRTKTGYGCAQCHHLHKVGDVGTPCSECHRAQYAPTDVFNHQAHLTRLGGNTACVQCHGQGVSKSLSPSGACHTCHERTYPMMSVNPVINRMESPIAVGYKDAMHTMCIGCHQSSAADPTVNRPDLARCGTCHNEGTPAAAAYQAASRLVPPEPRP